MSGAAITRRVFLPSLAAELPDDWSVSEQATFRSPAGTVIHAHLDRLDEATDSSEIVREQLAHIRAADDSVADVIESSAALAGGLTAPQVSFTLDLDGVALKGRIASWVEDGLALTVTGTTPGSHDTGEDEIDQAFRAVRLLQRPLVRIGSAAPPPASRVRAEKTPVAEFDKLRGSWSRAAPALADLTSEGRWSPHELAVFASLLGSPTFPTVPVELLAALPGESLDAALTAVVLSLMARGLLQAGGDGTAELGDKLRTVADLAAFPDLAVSVERMGVAGTGIWWFGLRPDNAVQVTVLPNDVREISVFDPVSFVAHLLALALAGTRTEPDASSVHRGEPVAASLDDVIDGRCAISDVVRVQTIWKVGHEVRGGECVWGISGDGTLWLADDGEPGDETAAAWVFRAADIDEMRDVVVGYLPGQ